jgi:hypothetical protein
MSEATSDSAHGAPVRLLPPYDARFTRIFRAVMESLEVASEAVPSGQHVVQMFPREDGSLSVFLDFADGGSVGLIVPPGFWQLHAVSTNNVPPH